MKRIGILGHGFIEWGGGIDFLRMVMSSLHAVRPDLELHVLVPVPQERHPVRAFTRRLLGLARQAPEAAGHRPALSHVDELASSAQGVVRIHRIGEGDAALEAAARRLSLAVLIPAISPLPAKFSIPWVGYVFDFQHRYLAHLFTAEECRSRNERFSKMLTSARTAIVNSQAVAQDAQRFHPEARAQIISLAFSAAPQAAWFEPREGVAARYGVRQRYFLICNQFWKHKDHGTAFSAFARFAAQHPEIDLVCTGATDDYRDPLYFQGLQQFIADSGLIGRVHILGLVPKLDQIALLRSAIALIQPTLFEGGPGGGAVYDAVSLGVPCLVSDIAVNRELREPLVSFFPVGDPEGLSKCMAKAVSRDDRPAADAESLLRIGHDRRVACGRQLLAAIQQELAAAR